MARKPKASSSTSVESIRHKDKRANIPTEELRDFVAEDEKAPKTMLYPRDPSLDPQLVWKGKDEQDAEDRTRQPEQIRAFRDCWRIGVHSYLAYIRDILVPARELLTETGSVFVQIGDENVHLVRCVLDEISVATTSSGSALAQRLDGYRDERLWRQETIRCPN